MLPNLHKQVSGGKLRYLRTQVSDRPWAKEPAPLGFWGGEGSPGGGWGGGVGFAFVARAGKGRCPSRAPGVPPAPPVSPRLRRPYCAPTSQPLAPHPRTPTAGPAPPGVPAGGPEPRRRARPTRSYLERSPRREALRGSGLLSGTAEAEAARDTGGVVRGAGRQGQEGQAPGTPHPGSPGTRRARS